MRISYSEYKRIVTDNSLGVVKIEQGNSYILVSNYGSVELSCNLKKDSANETDYNTNLSSFEGPTDPVLNKLNTFDEETGGIKITSKFAPDGWLQRLHEVEFTTSKVDGDIHDKDFEDNDYGWSSIDFYEDINGVETLMVSPTQNDLDTKCIRTDFKWMPTVNYMMLSGVVAQHTIPTNLLGDEVDFYFWGMFLDVEPALQAAPYSISPIEVLGGGMNMRFVNPRDRIGLKGVSGSTVYYDGLMYGGNFIQLTPGLGTNRIKFMFRHPAGLQHRMQTIFEIFRP